ncbi:hypothetical protein LTS18_006373 [Coniosporium uncinatum]|uniref:Uncharacterized protein n=1 Tax=Coniosporium uncinatum TaxID=93489 RepID=A0ACC3DXA2_9PEZI|nr:hypothetical protein LTS18_006373 [Coniosporium uncinatum]
MAPLRPSQAVFRATRQLFQRQTQQLKTPFQRRHVTTPAETNVEPPKAEGFSLARYWNSPIGPKTVHFWAPVMKWGVVLAGAADFAKPADKLSLNTNMALMATGSIWTRWCFVIKPKNYFLAAVNFFLFLVGATQTARVLNYQRAQKGETLNESIKDLGKQQVEVAKDIAKDPVGKMKDAVGAK